MSVKLSQIEDAIITNIKAALTGEGTVNTLVGDVRNYLLRAEDFQPPAYLVKFVSSQPYQGKYPGTCLFEVYVIYLQGNLSQTIQREIYDDLDGLYAALHGSRLSLGVNSELTFQDQSVYDDSGDYMIYVQKYLIEVIN